MIKLAKDPKLIVPPVYSKYSIFSFLQFHRDIIPLRFLTKPSCGVSPFYSSFCRNENHLKRTLNKTEAQKLICHITKLDQNNRNIPF